jgi:hypothetical protein
MGTIKGDNHKGVPVGKKILKIKVESIIAKSLTAKQI